MDPAGQPVRARKGFHRTSLRNQNSWDFTDSGEFLVKSSGFGGVLWAGFGQLLFLG